MAFAWKRCDFKLLALWTRGASLRIALSDGGDAPATVPGCCKHRRCRLRGNQYPETGRGRCQKRSEPNETRPAVLTFRLSLARNQNLHNPLGRMPIPPFRYPPGPALPVQDRLRRRQNHILLIANNDVGAFFAGDGAFGVMACRVCRGRWFLPAARRCQ